MHIGIDARMYGSLARGIGRYVQETITHLEKIDTKNTYTIFLYTENFNEYTPKNPNFKKVLAPWRWYTYKEQIHFPKLIAQQNVDLMHFPHFNVPYFYNEPYIVTLHDLILLRDTQERATTLGPIIYRAKKIVYKQILKHALFAAKNIITVTHFGKKDVLDYYNLNAENISVIYEGVSHDKLPSNSVDTSLNLRYNISKPFLVYVGSAYPHKNLELLIQAVDEITKKHDIELLLVGKKDFFYQRLEKEFPRSYVKYLGFVPDEDLAPILAQAQAYVFPSRYEGFGLPPLDAMINGCPVISSNASCLPEVLGDAALYCDPFSQESIEQAIEKILTQTELKQELVSKGYKQVQKYNWQTSAEQTLNLYNRFAA